MRENDYRILHHRSVYELFVKRFLDIFFSLLLILLLSWLFLALVCMVRFKLGTPVFFHQKRPGCRERVFELYKFRSMRNDRDENGDLLSDEKRMTEFGKKLRATSLDELPELFNILRGEMSFVGPRPLLVSYLSRYDERQHRRHEVRPGLTGYAQVHGRNALSWQERFEKDIYYVDHLNFLLDFRIVLDTIRVVLKRDGISAEGTVTMDEFKGNED